MSMRAHEFLGRIDPDQGVFLGLGVKKTGINVKFLAG